MAISEMFNSFEELSFIFTFAFPISSFSLVSTLTRRPRTWGTWKPGGSSRGASLFLLKRWACTSHHHLHYGCHHLYLRDGQVVWKVVFWVILIISTVIIIGVLIIFDKTNKIQAKTAKQKSAHSTHELNGDSELIYKMWVEGTCWTILNLQIQIGLLGGEWSRDCNLKITGREDLVAVLKFKRIE